MEKKNLTKAEMASKIDALEQLTRSLYTQIDELNCRCRTRRAQFLAVQRRREIAKKAVVLLAEELNQLTQTPVDYEELRLRATSLVDGAKNQF